jgi:hypothetical protein
MKITTFNCRHCGASLSIPKSPGTMTCHYCGSRHRVSFEGGSVSAELIAKVKEIGEDVANLKAKQEPHKAPPSLKDRLEMIGEGRQKWHQYFSSVKAGMNKKSPGALAVFNQAQAKLIAGYGPSSGPLIEKAYGPELLDVDTFGGYSCLIMMIGGIVLSVVVGAIIHYSWNSKLGMILVGIGFAGIVAGIPFALNIIRMDKASLARRKEALEKLDVIEQEIRRSLAAGKTE